MVDIVFNLCSLKIMMFVEIYKMIWLWLIVKKSNDIYNNNLMMFIWLVSLDDFVNI